MTSLFERRRLKAANPKPVLVEYLDEKNYNKLNVGRALDRYQEDILRFLTEYYANSGGLIAVHQVYKKFNTQLMRRGVTTKAILNYMHNLKKILLASSVQRHAEYVLLGEYHDPRLRSELFSRVYDYEEAMNLKRRLAQQRHFENLRYNKALKPLGYSKALSQITNGEDEDDDE